MNVVDSTSEIRCCSGDQERSRTKFKDMKMSWTVGLLSRTWVTKVFFLYMYNVHLFSDVELAVDSYFLLLTSNTVIRNLKLQYFVCDNVLQIFVCLTTS